MMNIVHPRALHDTIRRMKASHDRRGQATLEYIVTAGIILAMVGILALFLYTFKEYGGRILDLIASEYP